jgi:ABC-type glycerol-3-phosphate transport system substrate-binding protein
MASPGTFARSHSHSAFQSTKYADASWEWVRFLATPFYEGQFCKMGLWLPNQTAMMTEEGMKTWMDPQVHPQGYEMIVKDYMNKDGKTFLYPLHWNEAYNDLIKPGLDAVFNGDKKAQDVFTEITPQANAVIQKV